jgi:predicted CXXCH cytochrome family protein
VRISSTIMKVAMVIALIAIMMFAFGGVAFATDPIQNGPTPPALGDPVGGNIAPHGGYSSSTNYCLQCHSMHNAGETALLAETSTTATCQTCHKLFGQAATGARNSNNLVGATLQMGTAATRSAYDLANAPAQHTIGEYDSPAPDNTVITAAEWAYRAFPGRANTGPKATTPSGPGSASAAGGGLYCGSCHTPHGDFGQLINSRWLRTQANEGSSSGVLTDVNPWQNDAAIYQYAGATGTSPTIFYLYNDAGAWKKCPVPTSDPAWSLATCTMLTKTNRSGAPTDDIGQENIYLYGYKLLSAYPNHNYGTPESWGVGYRDTDAARWCGACHASKVSDHFGAPFTENNHPTACGYCHGIPSDQSIASTDYPHTSTKVNFLVALPDALCIGTCHTQGSLP